jgi:hypothetical protein
MPKELGADALAQQASFVFKGTIMKLKAATMKAIPVTDRTAIVRVDEVIHAPESLAQYAGQDITVQLGGRKKATKGQQFVFYANGLMFGDTLAVQSLDHHEPSKVHEAVAMAAGDPSKRLLERKVQARAATADAVVSGRVVSVRVPTDVVTARASAVAATGEMFERVSEHDPDWRIAEVQVDEVHSGSHDGKSVEVRFPSSDDVMWHYAPKFHPGSEGLFILHKTSKERAAASAAPTKDGGEYVCLNPADFQPLEKLGELKNAIGLLPKNGE